jgi:hypothetical protein
MPIPIRLEDLDRALTRSHGWLLATGISIACYLLVFVDHAALGRWLPGCLFRRLTGLYCPGCGATRALNALLHGDVPTALSMNPLLVIVVSAGVLTMADRLAQRPARFAVIRAFMSDARPWAAFIVMFVIARNLPWAPFAYLAPG